MSANVIPDSELQFHEKTISQLVHELNNLGESNIVMQPSLHIGIIDRQSQLVRRFRSKSFGKSCNESRVSGVRDSRESYGTTAAKDREEGMKQFFLTEASQKKYYYDQICNQLEIVQMGKIMSMWDRGFNTNVLLQDNPHRFKQFISKVEPWIQISEQDRSFYASFIQYQAKEAVDLLSSNFARNIPLTDATEAKPQFQQSNISIILSKLPKESPNLKILRIIKNAKKHNRNDEPSPQLRIILFPSAFFCSSWPSCHPSLKLTKSQITQILTYIRAHPNKKYENINKLLPKRYAVTTVLAEILLYDSVNVVLNWVADGQKRDEIGSQKGREDLVNGRFQFFGKMWGLSNLVKKVLEPIKRNILVNNNRSIQKGRNRQKQGNWKKVDKNQKIDQQTNENESPKSQLQYCRSLERKTHKYSLPQPEPLFPQTLPIYPPIAKQLNQTQYISLLKSRHAEEVFQYHQTIQSLNKKIMVLVEQKGVAELYAIHEKQIMMLELKIEQLRGDIKTMCEKQTPQTEIKNLREMVKKLNEQILKDRKSGTSIKVSQGKIKMLEKEVSQWKQKYTKSQIARKELKLQLDSCVNRLNLHTQANQPEPIATTFLQSLSPKQVQTLTQLTELSRQGISKQNTPYILQKCKTILATVSQLRQTVLKCHNFLVQLQDWVEERFGQKEPELVLECNRFIRTYLMDNLDIF